MNHKTSVISKYDFERYEVLLPFLCASGKRKQNFLFGELEKMHPCFSDEFSFDSDFKRITRKGICSDVFVINKRKLAEYEEKRWLQGAGFHLENQTGKKRFFVSRKTKTMLAGCGVCVLTAVTGIAFSAAAAKRALETNAEAAPVPVEIPTAVLSEESIPVTGELAEQFLEVVKTSEGSILSFSWEYDGFKERLSAFVQKVYPEQLELLSAWNSNGEKQQVSYSKGIPEISVNYSRKIDAGFTGQRKSVENKDVSYAAASPEFYRLMRSVLKTYSAELVTERLHPYSIEFLISQKKVFSAGSLFEEIAGKAKEFKIALSKINIQQQADGDLLVDLFFEEAFSEGINLLLLRDFAEVFRVRIPEAARPVVKQSLVNQSVQQKQNKTSLKKLGEIREKDGRLTVFYKNEEGKMIRQTEVKK